MPRIRCAEQATHPAEPRAAGCLAFVISTARRHRADASTRLHRLDLRDEGAHTPPHHACCGAGLATATMWPVAVLNCATLIDSAFDVACIRAARGGKLLAGMLLSRLHGDRPVTLLGVAMGARLVFYCLLELYRQGASAPPPPARLLLPWPPTLGPGFTLFRSLCTGVECLWSPALHEAAVRERPCAQRAWRRCARGRVSHGRGLRRPAAS